MVESPHAEPKETLSDLREPNGSHVDPVPQVQAELHPDG